MRLQKTVLSENPEGILLSICDTTIIHKVPRNVFYEEVRVYAVNPSDHPIEIVLQVTGISDESHILPVGRIPYEVMIKSLDPNDLVTICTTEQVELTGFVNRSTKN